MTYAERSNWVMPDSISEKELSEYKGLSRLVSELLYRREIPPKDQQKFLEPDLADIYPWKNLHGTKEAAKKILKAAKDGKKIFIHGDFDADGICASTIIWEFLYKELAKELDKEVDALPYIPDRIDEGYGLSEVSIGQMREQGAELVITVDCGIRDKELIQKTIKEEKIDIIVTDHHQPPDNILDDLDYTIVHQMFPGEEYDNQSISGAAVAFLLVQAIKAEAGMDDEIKLDTIGLDLVGLSTVTDMMPITDINRVFVSYGLKQMRNTKREGLKALYKVAAISGTELEAYHIGFVIGPRINAAGRIGSGIDGVRLLAAGNPAQADKQSKILNDLNVKRQEITEDILKQARKDVYENMMEDSCIFVLGKDWPEGIIGLVAGKLMESFKKPVLVATDNNGEVRGSARSLIGFNVTEALDGFADNLEKYGGHAQAAGFTVKEGQIEEFEEAFVAMCNEQIGDGDLVNELVIDARVDTDDISIELYEELEKLKPFGYGNSKPNLILESVVVIEKKVMGKDQNHMKLKVKGNGLEYLDVLMFNCVEDIELIEIDDILDVVGSIGINEWNGMTTLQFMVKEWRKVS